MAKEINIFKKVTGKKPVLEFLEEYKRTPEYYIIEKILVKENLSKKIINKIYELNLSNKLKFLSHQEFNSYEDSHQGIIIFYNSKKVKNFILKNDTPRPPLNLTLKKALAEYPGIYVLTDRIQDPQNLGSIIRSSEAIGAMGVIITGKGSTLNETVMKVSTSAFLYLPIFQESNASNILIEARKYNYWILATTTRKSKKTISLWNIQKLPESHRFILMMGSEGEGLKPILLEEADYWLEIPMLGYTKSLNVANSLSILLYELIKYIYH